MLELVFTGNAIGLENLITLCLLLLSNILFCAELRSYFRVLWSTTIQYGGGIKDFYIHVHPALWWKELHWKCSQKWSFNTFSIFWLKNESIMLRTLDLHKRLPALSWQTVLWIRQNLGKDRANLSQKHK